LDSAPTRIQLYFRAPSRPETQQCRCPLTMTLPGGVHPLPQSRSTSIRQANTSHSSCGRSRLGSSGPKNGTTKRSRHRTHSTGGRNRAKTGVERHHRPQSHVQKLLGSVEVARCKRRHSRAQLGIRQRPVQNDPNSHPAEQNKGRVNRNTRWTVRRSPGCQ
jgi:hypothetical protein